MVERMVNSQLPKPKVSGSNPLGGACNIDRSDSWGRFGDVGRAGFVGLLPLAALLLVAASPAQEPPPEADCDTPTHCVLVGFPRFYMDADEPDGERAARLRAHAEAIDAATPDLTERAWLIMTAWKESRFASFVDYDEPRCRKGISGWCDSGKSFSVYQVRGISRDSSREEVAKYALDVFRRGANYCQSNGHERLTGGVAMYARGNACTWAGAAERVAMISTIVRRTLRIRRTK